MIIALNSHQILKLSDLCMDIAKGLLLASLLTQLYSSAITIISTLRSIIIAMILIYSSLALLGITKEGK